ncbi:MAG: DNA-processing protein DprA [Candidatus Peribacteraceae bacterium]|nr:DNA-processing protein DprA [Candidatus Peribacteraceae bacterium]MDD5742029.1 DNA-processing protein DprA [Candidatus Peribacteraceae bacterium]
MDRTTALTWSWLNILNAKRLEALLRVYGDLAKALQHLDEPLLKELGCRDETVYATLNRLEEFNPETYEKELKKRDLSFLTIEDDAYPAHLKEIPDAPVFLYWRGDLSILGQPTIALVGTREMSDYGKRVTESIVPVLVRAGLVTVSGLALGIDALVARETMNVGGRTVAVLGHGLGKIYPVENARLAEEIVADGGLILSEFPLDALPGKYTFPARNRIIAGLSLGTVVLEAPEGSGALITADLALDYGREVFVVPGPIFDPHYAGCHKILSKGHAKLVSSAADILAELGVIASETPSVSYDPKSAAEAALLKVLTTMPQTADDLMERSGLPAAQIASALTMMELQGAVKQAGGGKWVRG